MLDFHTQPKRAALACTYTSHRSQVTSHLQVRATHSDQKYNRGAQLRGRSAPVVPVRLRRWRARSVLRGVFVAAQEFVSFNLGYHSDASWFVAFGPLDAAETPDLNGSSKRDFMGQSQKDLHGRPVGDLLREEEVNSARTYIPGFCRSFSDRRPARPANDHG